MKTIMPKQIETAERKWYIIDASWLTLWRLSTKLAIILKGKNKVSYSGHVDNGDYVVVINADKFKVTGKKMTDKNYYTHSGYLGGLKTTALEDLLKKKPTKALEHAVSGMLPKNKLRSSMISRLKLVTGTEHQYTAQKPQTITL